MTNVTLRGNCRESQNHSATKINSVSFNQDPELLCKNVRQKVKTFWTYFTERTFGQTDVYPCVIASWLNSVSSSCILNTGNQFRHDQVKLNFIKNPTLCLNSFLRLAFFLVTLFRVRFYYP